MKLVARIEPSIFRGYDIRGVMDQDLNEDVYYTLGRAYATFLARRRITDSAVGYDNRLNSLQYAQAFIAGLNEGGINTVDIGLTLSQIVYFSAYLFRFKGSAMITASHNPKEFNGLKLGVGYSDTMITQEIQELKQIATESKFSTGKGNNRQQDIFAVYAADVLSHFKLGKRWKVVVDACNTGAGVFMPKLLREAGCEVIEQNTTPDGNFPLGVPDPTEVTVVKRLAKGVVAAQAHIGFGYDADGDRMAVVDAQGNIIWMDSIVALFAQDVLDFLPGAPIVFNTLCSRQVIDAIEKNGGRIEESFYCTHRDEDNCDCRKPKSGLLERAAKKYGVDLTDTYFIGDTKNDVIAGKNAGCKMVVVLSGKAKRDEITDWDEKPDYVFQDLLEAVKWLMREMRREGL